MLARQLKSHCSLARLVCALAPSASNSSKALTTATDAPAKASTVVCTLEHVFQTVHQACFALMAGRRQQTVHTFACGLTLSSTVCLQQWMGQHLPSHVRIVEVGPRDGLQNEKDQARTPARATCPCTQTCTQPVHRTAMLSSMSLPLLSSHFELVVQPNSQNVMQQAPAVTCRCRLQSRLS